MVGTGCSEPNQPGRLNDGSGPSQHAVVPDVIERSSSRRRRGLSSARSTVQTKVANWHMCQTSSIWKTCRRTAGWSLFRDSTSTLFFVRLDGTAAEAVATTVQTGEPVGKASFSPDDVGSSIMAGRPAAGGGVYVQEFPGPGLRKQIAGTGESPVWRKDGKEILYLDQDRIWSVRVDTSGGEFRASAPRAVVPRSFLGGRSTGEWDLAACGVARRLAHLLSATSRTAGFRCDPRENGLEYRAAITTQTNNDQPTSTSR